VRSREAEADLMTGAIPGLPHHSNGFDPNAFYRQKTPENLSDKSFQQ
jgi:hypothetical protein